MSSYVGKSSRASLCSYFAFADLVEQTRPAGSPVGRSPRICDVTVIASCCDRVPSVRHALCAKFDPLISSPAGSPVHTSAAASLQRHSTERCSASAASYRQAPPQTCGRRPEPNPPPMNVRHDTHILGLHAEHAAEIALNVLHALRLVETVRLCQLGGFIDYSRGIRLIGL